MNSELSNLYKTTVFCVHLLRILEISIIKFVALIPVFTEEFDFIDLICSCVLFKSPFVEN